MISESSFAAVFGAAVPGGEDPLIHLARYAIRAGFAIVPCLPKTKQPMCTLAERDKKRADTEAQEAARAAGKRRWDLVRHTCGVKHALTDEKKSDTVIRRLVRDYGRINLGVELGASRVIVVDVDTDAEREAFAASWLAATGQPLPFGMTVQSPGVMAAGGEWKHKNGGHYWFALPPGLILPGDEGAMKDPGGWIAMWSARQVLVPPSERDEGPYLLTGDIHPAPQWLLERIVGYIIERRTRAKVQEGRRAAGGSGFTGEAHIDGWSVEVSWADLLEPDGWFDTGIVDSCGCSIWTAPGVHASYKSATAHDVGCGQYDDAPGHCPLHVWTDNPPEFLINPAFGDKPANVPLRHAEPFRHRQDVQQRRKLRHGSEWREQKCKRDSETQEILTRTEVETLLLLCNQTSEPVDANPFCTGLQHDFPELSNRLVECGRFDQRQLLQDRHRLAGSASGTSRAESGDAFRARRTSTRHQARHRTRPGLLGRRRRRGRRLRLSTSDKAVLPRYYPRTRGRRSRQRP